jgi:uncharacterized membrane protein YccC
MNTPRSSRRAVQALRVAAAAAIALIVAEWWHLPHTNLAVWTTHMVMSSHPHTTFQKGVERVVGRGAGILLGTLLVSLLGEQKLLALGLELAGLLAFFYAHFCRRLAYTYQNAGSISRRCSSSAMATRAPAGSMAAGCSWRSSWGWPSPT